MTSLFACFESCADKARRGFITIHECMVLMEQCIDECENQYRKKAEQKNKGIITQEQLDIFWIDKRKAYHRMFKLLHDITKAG